MLRHDVVNVYKSLPNLNIEISGWLCGRLWVHDEHAQWSVCVSHWRTRGGHNTTPGLVSLTKSSKMSFIHHAIAKKIKEDKEKDKMVMEVLYLAVVLIDYVFRARNWRRVPSRQC